MSLLCQLLGIHFRRWRHPQLHRNVTLVFKQFAGGPKMTDVGHAGTDKDLIDLGACHFRQGLDVVRVIRARHDGLLDIGEVNFNDGCILGVSVTLEQLRILQPSLHGLDTAVDGTHVRITRGNHPFQHRDVACDVLDDGLFVQMHGAATSAAFGRSITELKCLLYLQIGQTFNLKNASRKNVLLALFGNGQQASLDGIQRYRIDQIPQRDTGLHVPLEPHQHTLGHVEWHHAGSGTKRDQTGTGRETDANGKTGMAVTARSYSIRQQHAIQPAVDDAVTWAQGNTAACTHEFRQFVMHLDIHRLRVGGRMTKRLHDQVCTETQTSQILQFVAGHGAGRVLRADAGHPRLTISARTHTLAFWQAAGTTDHFLSQREPLARVCRVLRQSKQRACGQTQRLSRLGRKTPTNDQGDAAACAHLVKQHIALDLEFSDHLAVFERLALIRPKLDNITHIHLTDIEFNRQRTRIFHRVIKNRRDF